MGTYLSIRRTGFKALLITAAVMVMLALSAACVYAADTASITEVSPANPEVNKEITVKAKGDFSLFKSDYVYFRVTANLAPEPFHEYEGVKRGFATSIATYKFTPAQEGSYLIEVCAGPADSSGNHVDLAEEDFVAEDRRTITVQKDISKAETSIAIENPVYTGSELTPKPVVTVDGKTLAENTDYEITSYANNTNAGEATITITGKGFYKGTKSASFQIQPADITEASVTGIVDREYGSYASRQDPRVVLNEKLLVNEQDYVFACENYENAGTATVVITGTNNYTGEIRIDYTVDRVSIHDIGDPALTNQTYTGSPITLNMSLWYGRTLVEGEDYTATYKNNTDPGTATVTITGIGNFKDSKTRTFTINEAAPSGSFYIALPKNNTEFDVDEQIDVSVFRLVHMGSGYNYIYARVLKDGAQVSDLITYRATDPMSLT